jgi:broad specificity phosphatase PhoE
MLVILMRHGKPSLPPQKSVSSLEFKNWIDSYNSAELCENLKPPKEAVEIAKTCNATLCSNLRRSLSSARMLGISEANFIEHNFREMEMPWGKLANLKIKPKYWAVIFRILWFFGYSENSESFKEAKLRAGNAASLLESIAKEKHSVLFVGHGILNHYIAKSLAQNGWLVRKKVGSNYWEFGIFECEA